MATIVEESTKMFADVIASLGDVPLNRILATPAPGTAVEADVVRLADSSRKRLCELVDGVLVEKAMGAVESRLTFVLARWLDTFVEEKKLGIVYGADGLIRLFPGQVRIPDIAFFSWDRLPGRETPKTSLLPFAPDLAVEALSVSNTPGEMSRKRDDYFKAGVRLVWEIDWRTRSATAWTAPDQFVTLTENDSLDGGDVVPGFSVTLTRLFAVLDRHG